MRSGIQFVCVKQKIYARYKATKREKAMREGVCGDNMKFPLLYVVMLTTVLCIRGEMLFEAILEYDEQTKNTIYSCIVIVGTPPIELHMAVDFSIAEFIVFENLPLYSDSFSKDDNTDRFYAGINTYRVNMIFDPTLALDERYVNRKGVFGFGQGSFIWRIWPEISFSPDSIRSGRHYLMENSPFVSVNCDPSRFDSLCTLISPAITENFQTALSFTSNSDTILPSLIYNNYLRGKNVFHDDIDTWNPLLFELPGGFNLYLPPRGGIVNSEDLSTHLALEPTTNNEVSLGLNVFKEAIVVRNSVTNTMDIKRHRIFTHLPLGNIIVLVIIFTFICRWKLTNLSKINTSSERKHLSIIDVALQIIAIPLYTTAFFLPETVEIMAIDFPVIYAMIGATMITLTVLAILSIIASVYCVWCNEKCSEDSTYFMISLAKNFSYEVLMGTALFLLLIGRRTEGIASILGFIALSFVIYAITYYLVVILLLGMTSPSSAFTENLNTLYFLFIFIILVIYAFFIYLTYHVFARTLLFYFLAKFEPNVATMLSANVYFMTVNVTLYMISLYISKKSQKGNGSCLLRLLL